MSSERQTYVLHSRITDLSGPVLCLSVTEDGKLASGGTFPAMTGSIVLILHQG